MSPNLGVVPSSVSEFIIAFQHGNIAEDAEFILDGNNIIPKEDTESQPYHKLVGFFSNRIVQSKIQSRKYLQSLQEANPVKHNNIMIDLSSKKITARQIYEILNQNNITSKVEDEVTLKANDFKRIMETGSFLPNVSYVVNEDLKFFDYSGELSFPDNLLVKGGVWIDGYKGKLLLPKKLKLEGSFDVFDCDNLNQLPKELEVKGCLLIKGGHLKNLPETLVVGQDLYLSDCDQIIDLPKKLKIQGSLSLTNCSLETLPDGLTIGKDLILQHCLNLKTLPNKLHVKKNLSIIKSQLTKLPDDLMVGGDISLDKCPALNNVAK